MYWPAALKKQSARDVAIQARLGILFIALCSGLDKSIREAKGDDSFINWFPSVQANDTAWLGDQRLRWSQQGPGGLGPILQDCVKSHWIINMAGSVLTGFPPI